MRSPTPLGKWNLYRVYGYPCIYSLKQKRVYRLDRYLYTLKCFINYSVLLHYDSVFDESAVSINSPLEL